MEVTVVNNGAASSNAFAASQAQGGVTGGDSMNGTQNGSAAIAAASVLLFFCFVNRLQDGSDHGVELERARAAPYTWGGAPQRGQSKE